MNRKLLPIALAIPVLILFLTLGRTMNAQSAYGAIVGTVTDSGGALVPGATVTVTNVGTNETRTMQTGATGEYRFVDLLPADYKVAVTAKSFKRYEHSAVNVQVDGIVRIDVALPVGAATETVEVTTQTPLLNTDSTGVSDAVEGERVQEMPLNGRNTMNLIALTPGVVAMAPSEGSALNMGTHSQVSVWSDYSIGGGFSGSNAMYVDGATVNLIGGQSINMIPTQDSTQEFSIQTSGVSAEFGRFGGGVINLTTKGGSNQWHGSLYEYLRNRDFNANLWNFNNTGTPRPMWTQNQYGATLGNPILRNKLFSFFSWEGYRLQQGYSTNSFVPTASMRAGKFYKALTITDPLAKQLGRAGCITRGSDAGGPYAQIATSCIDPTAAYMLANYWPNENYTPGDGAGGPSYNYVPTPTPIIGNNSDTYSERVDYNLGQNHRVFARWAYNSQADLPYEPLNSPITANAYTHIRAIQATLGDTYTINQKTIVDIRLSYSRNYNDNTPPTFGKSLSVFGGSWGTIQNELSIKYYPTVNVQSSSEIRGNPSLPGAMGVYSAQTNNTYDLIGSITRIWGPHSLKFGAEGRLSDQNGIGFSNGAAGSFTFSESASSPLAGDSWADFLLGVPASGSAATFIKSTTLNNYAAFYGNDTWQMTRRLTVNIGLRWELPGSNTEKHNWATVLQPTTQDPFISAATGYPLVGFTPFVGSAYYPSRWVSTVYHNLVAPRLGASYRISDKDVLRASYGVAYPDATPSISLPTANASTSWKNLSTGNNQYTPNQTGCYGLFIQLSNPFPAGACPVALIEPTGNSNPAFTVQSNNKRAISGNVLSQPYELVQQWSVSYGHEFPRSVMAEVSYIGSSATNLPVSLNLDELQEPFWSSTYTIGNTPLYTPYGAGYNSGAYYSSVAESNAAIGIANYNAATVKAEKRFKSGGLLAGNYTFARALSDTESSEQDLVSSNPSSGSYVGYPAQDTEHLRQVDYSLSGWNLKQRAVISYVLNLPFGQGQKYAHFTGVPGAIVSGWAFNGITSFQTGFPLSIAQPSTVNTLNNYGYTIRPTITPACNARVTGSAKNHLNPWFNTSCYAYTTAFAYGTEPRVDKSLRTDGLDNWDFSLLKSTKIGERLDAQFRAEFFNTFNHPQFAAPGNTLPNIGATNNFGVVSYQFNQPRLIQLSLRINY